MALDSKGTRHGGCDRAEDIGHKKSGSRAAAVGKAARIPKGTMHVCELIGKEKLKNGVNLLEGWELMCAGLIPQY